MINRRLGESFYNLDMYDKALEYLTEADTQSEGKDKFWDARIDLYLGETYMQLDSLSKGRNFFKSAMDLNGIEDAWIPYSIGFAYQYKLEDYNEAIKYYNQAVEIDAEYAPIYYHRAYSYNMLAKNDKDKYYDAIMDISKAIVLEPKAAEYYQDRGDYKNSYGISTSCGSNMMPRTITRAGCASYIITT